MARTELKLSPAPARLKSIQIEPTSYCNLKCAGCNRTWREGQGTLVSRHMALETFARVIDHLPPGDVCWLNGYGEPTLNIDLPDMVATAKTRFDQVYVISNLLARGIDFYRALERKGLDQLHVSVDSLNPEVADTVRYGTDVVKLRDRLGEVRAALQVSMTINIVVSEKNLYDIPNTLAYLNRLAGRPGGFDVGFADFGAFADDDYDYSSWFTNTGSKAIFNKMIAPLIPKFSNLNFRNEEFKQRRRKRPTDRCERPFFDPAVTVDGHLVPCCVELHNADHYRRTSIVDQDFQTAWAAPGIQEWLKDYLREEPSICRECCLNPYRNEKKVVPLLDRLLGREAAA
jgi:MoaA/NifB/PqqE/SkfB family radical SAM enzyme